MVLLLLVYEHQIIQPKLSSYTRLIIEIIKMAVWWISFGEVRIWPACEKNSTPPHASLGYLIWALTASPLVRSSGDFDASRRTFVAAAKHSPVKRSGN